MASIKEVAQLAGVGIGTVSRVINGGSVSENTRVRVDEAIRKLNYVPNYSAQTLKTQRAGIIGLFVPVFNNPFFCAIADRIEAQLNKEGYNMLVVCSQEDKEKELRVLRLLAQNRVDGAIFVTHNELGEIDETLPLVTIDRHLGKEIPCITSDNYESTARAVELMIEKGSRNVAYVGGKPLASSEVEMRYKAYLDVMAKHGFEPIVYYKNTKHGQDYSVALDFFSRYGDRVDAVFCSGDTFAYLLYQFAVQKYEIPSQFRIVSYDGVMRNWVGKPDISCVKQDIDQMAQRVVEALFMRINGEKCERKITVPTSFHIGETV